MSIEVSSDVVIHRSAAEVAAYAADPAHAPHWYSNIEEVEWSGEALLRVGAKFAFVSRIARRAVAHWLEVREYVPGQRLVMRGGEGSFPIETTYTWEALADGFTRMTLRNRSEPTGLLRFVAPLLRPAVRRAIQRDLAVLKRRLESSPEEL